MTPLRLAALGLWLSIGSFATAQDSVKLRGGTVESGRIESENFDVLVLKTKNQKNEEKVLRLSWDDVLDVTYGGVVEYQKAISQVAAGNLGAAIPKLQELVAGTTMRKELKPLVMYQLGAALQRNGKFTEAAAAQLELVKAHPKTRYLMPAAQSIVDCYIAAGDPAGGAAAIEALVSAANTGGVDVSYIAGFDYYRGRLLEAQNNLVGARSKYQTASGARGGPATLTAMARLGMARCEQAEGKVEPARTAFRALTEQELGNEVLAGAWNGLADLAFEEAAKARNAEKITTALFMYLRGVVEYGPAPGEGTGEYERALAGAGKAFELLAEVETDDARKKQYAQRSKQRLDQLKKEFPNSPYLHKK